MTVDTPLRAFLVASLTLLAHPGLAFADAAAGESLYREGNELRKQGRLEEACSKWVASLREDESAGVAFLVAECDRKAGRTASAWAGFVLAERLAKRQNRKKDAEDAAKQAAELEPRLAYLTVRLADGVVTPAEWRVERDGKPLLAAALGAKIPVDPGPHVVRAFAPGRETWSTEIAVREGGAAVVVQVPALKPTATPAPAEPTRPTRDGDVAVPAPSTSGAPVLAPPPPTPTARPLAAYALLGVGAVAAGATAFFGVRALSSYRTATDACPTLRDCPASALTAREDAGTRARIADVTGAISVLAVGVGVFLLLRSPEHAAAADARPAPRRSIRPSVNVGANNLTFGLGGAL